MTIVDQPRNDSNWHSKGNSEKCFTPSVAVWKSAIWRIKEHFRLWVFTLEEEMQTTLAYTGSLIAY